MEWTVKTLNPTVDRELDTLPPDMRARFVRIADLIKAVGLERVGAPHIKHLSGPLWEMRIEGQGWDFAGALRDGKGEAGRRSAGLREEDPEDTSTGDRAGAAARPGGFELTRVSDLHKKWSRDPAYRAAYDEFGPEFELARSLIEARTRAGLTQAQLARRMKTTQSVVARLESGRVRP